MRQLFKQTRGTQGSSPEGQRLRSTFGSAPQSPSSPPRDRRAAGRRRRCRSGRRSRPRARRRRLFSSQVERDLACNINQAILSTPTNTHKMQLSSGRCLAAGSKVRTRGEGVEGGPSSSATIWQRAAEPIAPWNASIDNTASLLIHNAGCRRSDGRRGEVSWVKIVLGERSSFDNGALLPAFSACLTHPNASSNHRPHHASRRVRRAFTGRKLEVQAAAEAGEGTAAPQQQQQQQQRQRRAPRKAVTIKLDEITPGQELEGTVVRIRRGCGRRKRRAFRARAPPPPPPLLLRAAFLSAATALIGTQLPPLLCYRHAAVAAAVCQAAAVQPCLALYASCAAGRAAC